MNIPQKHTGHTLSLVMSSSAIYAVIIDKNLMVASANKKFEKRYSYVADNVNGKNFLSFFPEKEQTDILILFEQAFSGKEENTDYTMRLQSYSSCIDNSETVYSVVPIKNDQDQIDSLLIFGYDNDQSLANAGKKQLLSGILTKEDNMQEVLFNNLPYITWMCNIKGEMIFADNNFIVFTGINRSALLGRAWTDVISEYDMPQMQKVLQDALITKKRFQHTVRIRNRIGEYEEMMIDAKPAYNKQGIYKGLVGHFISKARAEKYLNTLLKVA